MLKKIGKFCLFLLSFSTIFGQKPLSLGVQAPDFSLHDQDGQLHSLLSHRGQYVLLFFYPKDNTPHCSKQALSFEMHKQELEHKNVVVYGISQDSESSHRDFKYRLNLSYHLLSDPKGKVASLYQAKGVFMNKRKAFLIGPDGKVFKIYEKLKPAKYCGCVLKDLAVCPKRGIPVAKE